MARLEEKQDNLAQKVEERTTTLNLKLDKAIDEIELIPDKLTERFDERYVRIVDLPDKVVTRKSIATGATGLQWFLGIVATALGIFAFFR